MFWWLGVVVLGLLSGAIAKRMWQDVPADPSLYNVASFAAWAGLSVVMLAFAVIIPLRAIHRSSR